MEKIFERQRNRSLLLRTEKLSERLKRLKRLETWVLKNRKSIQEALHSDFRKIPQETDLSETYVALTEIREARRNLRKWAYPKRALPNMPFWGTKAYVQYEPKGVCLIISPWNFPFQLAVGPLVSALAAGNTAIIKPSEFTPATSQLIKEMCQELFEEDLVSVFEGDQNVSSQLLALPFNHIFFTGSPRVGKIVMEAAAKHLTSVTLELGGKSPVFVDDTADISDTAEKLAWAKWMNAGQTCTAPDYVLVHKNRQQELLRELEKYAQELYSGGQRMTGIVNDQHQNRIKEWLQSSIQGGAKQVFGGVSVDQLGPTVLINVPEKSELLQEEIFGPILPIVSFESLDEAIAEVNSREKPLSLYVFSRSKRNIRQILQATSSGSAAINDAVIQFGHPELPFGGVNNSGFGKAHGQYGFISFSNEKSVLKQRRGLTMAKTLYPPYTNLKNKTIDLLLKYF